MNCTILTAEAFSRDLDSLTSLFRRLTKPGGDFDRKLHYWLTVAPAARGDGSIALVSEDDEIIGWCRTETWWHDEVWDTLEAFVADGHRGRGVAAFAAAGLVASGCFSGDEDIAVFAPSMLLLARRVGLHPVLFQKVNDEWEVA
jgi:GNAT superfamily N-acetyltransferase